MSKAPSISVSKMRQLDQLMVDEFNITIPQMMETAGQATAELARQLLGGDARGKNVLSASGVGNNGGDALVAARYLTNWGANVKVVISEIDKLHNIPKDQLLILQKMNLDILEVTSQIKNEFNKSDLIIDGIIGYNLRGNPRGKAAQLIELINRANKPVLAIDVPSGLDADTGKIGIPCIKALATLALSLPKIGSIKRQAQSVVGKLYVADMSVPKLLFNKLAIKLPDIFSKSSIVTY